MSHHTQTPSPNAVAIVDDDASVREGLEDLLDAIGFVTHVFPSAEAFLRSGDIEDNFCIITDQEMPGINGSELYRELRARGNRTPMIFISAFPERCHVDMNDTAGILALLRKPFDGGILIDHLRDALRMARDQHAV